MDIETIMIRCRDLLAYHAEDLGEDRVCAEDLVAQLNQHLGEMARGNRVEFTPMVCPLILPPKHPLHSYPRR